MNFPDSILGAAGLLPESGSAYASQFDSLFYSILAIATFFFLLIVSVMVVFVIKYRRREGPSQPAESATGNVPLQIIWCVIPLVIAPIIFYKGLQGHVTLAVPPPNTYDIEVTVRKASSNHRGWDFTYHDGNTQQELHCWKGQPFRVMLQSTDVIHSFFVPVFRLKMDVVPGRLSSAWFEASKAGEFELICAEYCGPEHWNNRAKVVVHETAKEFDSWLAKAGKKPDDVSNEDWGRLLWVKKGCKTCHSIDGKDGLGPSWLETADLYMHAQQLRKFEQGDPVQVDRPYLVESISEPTVKIVEGFASGNMPFVKISPEDIGYLIDFMISLKKSE